MTFHCSDWKVANGYLKAIASPPFNRLFYVPRDQTITELAKKFKESEKEAREREKLEAKERAELRTSMSSLPSYKKKELKVHVMAGRDLASKDLNGFSGNRIKKDSDFADPWCEISIKEQKFKTKIKKKTLNPVWDEEFTFSLIGLDLNYVDLEVVCWVRKHSEMKLTWWCRIGIGSPHLILWVS